MTRRKGPKPKKGIRAPKPTIEVQVVLPPVAEEEALPDPSPITGSPWWRDPFTYLLAMLPALILVWNTSPIYTPAGYLDPWIYYGYMQHLRPMKVLFPSTYYGSRLSWILPGALVRSILPSVPANYVLHLAVFFLAVFSAYWLLKSACGARVAALSAICLAANPYFWGAVGWDYVDGVGIAYYLLTLALLFNAAKRRQWRTFLIAAGASYAGLVYSNLAWAVFSPVFLAFFVWLLAGRSTRKIWKAGLDFFLWFGAGWAAVTVALSAANFLLEGTVWFYAPSVFFARAMSRRANPWKAPNYQWLSTAYWLILPAVACFAALVVCVRTRWKTAFGNVGVFFALNLLFTAAVMIYMDAHGNSLLQFNYYASYLIPGAMLALGPVLFSAVSAFPKSSFRFAVATAMASVLFIWALGTIPHIAAWAGPHQRMLVIAGLAILAGAIVFSRHPAAVFVGLMGFGLIGFGTRLAGDTSRSSASADAYHRIAAGMEAVEHTREGRHVRFWFDGKDGYQLEFNSLNSCYLWGFTAINDQFPSLAKETLVGDGSIIVIPSSKGDVGAEIAAAFTGRASIATPAGRTRLEAGGHGYWLHFFKVEPNPL